MKLTLAFLTCVLGSLLIVSSCGKDNDSPPEPLPEKDSLGVGWQRIDVYDTYFSDIFFVNNNIGFVCGRKYLGKSTDGGLTWKSVQLPAIGDDSSFVTLFFLDQTRGWAITSSVVYRTEDGGESWQGTKTGFFQHSDIQFLNDKEGYLTSVSNLAKSIDGGKTWQAIPSAGSDCRAVFFIDKNLGWLGSKAIYNTTNGGINFVSQNASVSNCHSAQFVDPLNGWFAGSDISMTRNGGSSWTTLKYPLVLTADVHFFDANKGYVSLGTRIYRTLDGGTTLSPLLKVPQNSRIIEIFFTDENHGWATSDKSILRYQK